MVKQATDSLSAFQFLTVIIKNIVVLYVAYARAKHYSADDRRGSKAFSGVCVSVCFSS